MTLSEEISEEKKTVARKLINEHYRSDSQMCKAKVFLSSRDRVIRILELTNAVPSSKKLTPFSFDEAPNWGINFRSSVILVNDADWQLILDGKLSLPKGWNLKTSVEMPRQESV